MPWANDIPCAPEEPLMDADKQMIREGRSEVKALKDRIRKLEQALKDREAEINRLRAKLGWVPAIWNIEDLLK